VYSETRGETRGFAQVMIENVNRFSLHCFTAITILVALGEQLVALFVSRQLQLELLLTNSLDNRHDLATIQGLSTISISLFEFLLAELMAPLF